MASGFGQASQVKVARASIGKIGHPRLVNPFVYERARGDS